MGRVRIVGDVSGKEYQLVETASGVFKIRNVTDGTDIVTADNTTITDVGGVKLNSHGSRHAYGQPDALPAASIDRTQLRPLGIHFVKSASPTPGVSDAYGTAVDINAEANKSIVLLYVKLSWGGTFGTGETVTIRVTVTFNDGSTAYIEKSATAVGDYWLADSEKASLMSDGKYVTKVSVASKSNLTSTSVTTTVVVYGLSI